MLTVVKCDICIRQALPPHKYCPRCDRLVDRAGRGMAHVIALKRDYDPVHDVFRCHYTGVVLDENDTKSPLYLTYDHLIPGLKTVDNLVITVAIINEMKTDLTWEEFVAIARQVVVHEDGGKFDERVLDVRHWLRFVKPLAAKKTRKRR